MEAPIEAGWFSRPVETAYHEQLARHRDEHFSDHFPAEQPAGVTTRHPLSKGDQVPGKTGLQGKFPATARTSAVLEILSCSYVGGDPTSCLCIRFNHQICLTSQTLLFSPCARPTCCLLGFTAAGPDQLCFRAANDQIALTLPKKGKTRTEREKEFPLTVSFRTTRSYL